MRRWFAAALLALLPCIASAKGMIVMDDTYASVAGGVIDLRNSNTRLDLRTRQLLDRLGSTYTVVPAQVAKTEFCRTGRMVWNYGTAGAYVEAFDWVCHLSFNGKWTSNIVGYRPDSLTLSVDRDGDGKADGCLVPQIFIVGQMGTSQAPGSQRSWMRDSTTDSCGIVQSSASSDIPSNHAQPCFGPPMSYLNGTTNLFWASSMHNGFLVNPTPPAGGFRILSRVTTNYGGRVNTSDQLNSLWVDSLGVRTLGKDTADVWVRPWSHITGAKEQIFCYPFLSGPLADSATNNAISEFTPENELLAFAHLDSITGGLVFDKLKPIKASLVISGAFRRSGSRNAGGISPDDTTSLLVGLDSLKTLGIPITVGVCSDSISTYPNEVRWWNNLGNVRFAVEQAAGDSGAVLAAGGNASVTHPFDPFGKRRTRFAVGDSVFHTVLGADSSTLALLVASKTQMSPYFPGRISGAVIPLSFDWSPRNANASSVWLPDSTLLACSLAGFSTIVIDGQIPQPRSNPIGIPGQDIQRRWIRYDPVAGSFRQMSVLAHSGFRINGSDRQLQVKADSVVGGNWPCGSAATSPTPNLIAYECFRFTHQLFWDFHTDPDYMRNYGFDAWDGVVTPLPDKLYGVHRGSILMTHVQDYAGGRPIHIAGGVGGLYAGDLDCFAGYWEAKAMNNLFRSVNTLAGRTLMTWSFPEDIDP